MLGIVVAGGDEGAVIHVKVETVLRSNIAWRVESLIEVPVTSSHMAVPVDVRIAAGIEPGYVRMALE